MFYIDCFWLIDKKNKRRSKEGSKEGSVKATIRSSVSPTTGNRAQGMWSCILGPRAVDDVGYTIHEDALSPCYSRVVSYKAASMYPYVPGLSQLSLEREV